MSALPRRPAAYKAAALLTELTRHGGIITYFYAYGKRILGSGSA